MSREEDIMYMLETDRIWPPAVGSKTRRRFERALTETLKRLPDKVFDCVYDDTCYVIHDVCALAMNVPLKITIPASKKGASIQRNQIVFFPEAFRLSDKALIGLIAHEIAHSLVEKDNHIENEKAADSLASKWGFSEELKEKDLEKTSISMRDARA